MIRFWLDLEGNKETWRKNQRPNYRMDGKTETATWPRKWAGQCKPVPASWNPGSCAAAGSTRHGQHQLVVPALGPGRGGRAQVLCACYLCERDVTNGAQIPAEFQSSTEALLWAREETSKGFCQDKPLGLLPGRMVGTSGAGNHF